MKSRMLFVPALLTVALGLVLPSDTRARQAPAHVDGCKALAILIDAEVTATGFYGFVGPGRLPVYWGPSEIFVCDDTARAVSSGFSKALMRLNIYVTWRPHPGFNGDYCESFHLSQCYPGGHPSTPFPNAVDYYFMMDTWRAVQEAVGENGPTGAARDVSRFDAGDLRRSLRLALKRRSVGTWEDYWQRYAMRTDR